MAIRTILVHLALDEDREHRLDASVAIANRLEAHLICLYVAAAVHMPAGATGRGASHAYLAEATARAKSKADQVRAEVEKKCSEAGVSWEWAYGEVDHFDHLMEHVHRTDLTILTQVQLNHIEDRLMYQLPEVVIQEAGGPVLILPKGIVPPNLGDPQHTLIAWRYSKECMRAVRDMLPILHSSQKISLLTMDLANQENNSPDPILKYLKTHRLTATAIHKDAGHAIGPTILDTAHSIGADRIVMGAYGRSSLRERIFMGPSRYVLGHSEIPIYMSH